MHIEKLSEGIYLATSEDIPGLVAQGRTITETRVLRRRLAWLYALGDVFA